MMAERVVFDWAPEGSCAKAPVKEEALDASSPKSCRSSVKRLSCVIVAGILLLVVPLYIWKGFDEARVVPEDPVSVLVPLGGDLDIDGLIRELNTNGERVYLASLLSQVADGCSAETPVLPKGKQTVVTFKTKENTEREAVVYVPDSYPTMVDGAAPRPVALMLLFHGLNDNCRRFLEVTKFMPYADRDGFVIASVCGSMGFLGHGWNAGMCCGFLGDKPDDVALAKQVVEELSQVLCIDKSRVMSVGFSNGAMLSEVLACEVPATFRAIVSVSGVVEVRPGNEAGLAACTSAAAKASSTARTSVLLVHGTADTLVPWPGNVALGFPSVMADLEGWRERNGCTEETNTTISTDTYTNTIYMHCSVLRSAVPRWIPDEADVEMANCYEGDPVLDVDLVERKAVDARLAKATAAVAREGLRVSHANPEYLSVGRKHGMVTAQRTDKWRFSEAHCHRRGFEAVEQSKARGRNRTTLSSRGKASSGSGDKSPDAFQLGQWLREAHLYADGTLSGLTQPFSRTAAKEIGKLPMQRDALSRVPLGASQVELVRVNGGGHHWPRDNDFSATDYTYEFGKRIFGRYN
ncbi:hypothetical protein LSCM1_00495 [Leishmania martiniquensis]|uniref:Uncharacterized protein n=1 Tax=Leishmania martiniquensis TaxID=1580590 RepID=A0A836GI53_9TRYP|nr:hypothetical protein LSCM1_00495 [Leishmania martiniquensis]